MMLNEKNYICDGSGKFEAFMAQLSIEIFFFEIEMFPKCHFNLYRWEYFQQ